MKTERDFQQQLLTAILDTTDSGFLVVDRHGRITLHNAAAVNLFKCTSADLAQATISDLFPQVFTATVDTDETTEITVNPMYRSEGPQDTTAFRPHDNPFTARIKTKRFVIDGDPFYVVTLRDWSRTRRLESELLTRQTHLDLLLDVINAALLIVDKNGVVQTSNDNTYAIFGCDETELHRFHVDDLLPDVFHRETKGPLHGKLCVDQSYLDSQLHETTLTATNARRFPATVLVKETTIHDEPGYIVRVRDLTSRKRTETELQSRKKRLETILNNAAEGIITFDERGVIDSFNAAAETLFGYTEREIIGQTIALLIPSEMCQRRDSYLEHFMRTEIQRLVGHEGEVEGRHKDGAKFPMALKISEIDVDGHKLYTGLLADISERKALVEHLKNVAEHDGLTGLYDRGYFQEELERVVERTRRGGAVCALLYIDLDNFKYVNDTLGHAAGDRVLVEVAAILRRGARKSDLIARLGGDEFAVLLYNIGAETVQQTADSFREQMANYRLKQGKEQVDIGCSIGCSIITPETKSTVECLSQADVACHLAKRAGRNRVHIFKPADEVDLTNMSLDMGWARRIRDAIKENQFALACQPIVNIQSGEIDSYEVLIRMVDENYEMIMPNGFLPSAERFGLSVDIDKWVIANAIETLAQQRKEIPTLRYSINLSAQTLSDGTVADLILGKLHATGLVSSALTFEVTETVAIAGIGLAESFLRRLQEIGCQTALDDFGAGFSSFAYLKGLPVDYVKIDGHFVKNLAKNHVDQAMVKAMNEIAHALGKQTVAEFVEDEASLKILRELGVDFAQGYYLGRPDVVLPCKATAENAGETGLCKKSTTALEGPLKNLSLLFSPQKRPLL